MRERGSCKKMKHEQEPSEALSETGIHSKELVEKIVYKLGEK